MKHSSILLLSNSLVAKNSLLNIKRLNGFVKCGTVKIHAVWTLHLSFGACYEADIDNNYAFN